MIEAHGSADELWLPDKKKWKKYKTEQLNNEQNSLHSEVLSCSNVV